ncbi:GNAT family N-acetyltransferase [Ruminococcus albus]|uniref:Acetyltransferase (GNAT) family protein n=1 Tax=Ruminococcus albus TaxID=1264 RepID=A0A1I1PAW2_RUMAL|nr:GNAT family N-acetyltransferase [Ruminococcus albus]SFD03100.1 Acetyltransferase (GNAT) family protein [Ruminococcus albus]
MEGIYLEILHDDDREKFIKDNQEAFNYGALEEFGLRDDHFEEEGEIISAKTIEVCIDKGEALRIMQDGKIVGGMVVNIKDDKGVLELLFVSPTEHGKGIGYAAWCEAERRYPQVKVWETFTPYFEKRNIHFYVNRCGFSIVEFFNKIHPERHEDSSEQSTEEMFRFEKRMDGDKI